MRIQGEGVKLSFVTGAACLLARSAAAGGLLMAPLWTVPARAQDGGPVTAADQQEPVFDTVLRPVRTGSVDVTGIAVRSVITRPNLPEGDRLSLAAPIVYAAVPGVADRVRDLLVADPSGIVPMVAEDDAPVAGGFPYYRHWRAQRAVTFPVTITYRSDVQPIGGRGSPPFGIRPSDGGVSGAGSGFLVIPENAATPRSRVRWDLSDMQDGSLAVSSFGDGAFELEGPAARLMQGWYMAGPAGRFPAEGDVDGFSATWLGSPPWDSRVEMAQAARVYTYLGETFSYLGAPPRYRMFVRVLNTPPFGGGTALTNSFMLSRGPARPGEGRRAPQGLLFHEMIHGFVGGIDAPQGVSSWFSEGLTSYYTSELQLRGGFVSVHEYGEDINKVARDYYTSPARNWSAARITQSGFGDEKVRHTPYRRGQLYFADLDARIRAASGGARSLDTVMREIFLMRAAGGAFDHEVWAQFVTRELGPAAAEEFRAVILEGATLVPASDAFGPCFERRPAVFEEGGQQIEGHQWERVAAVPDSACVRAQAR